MAAQLCSPANMTVIRANADHISAVGYRLALMLEEMNLGNDPSSFRSAIWLQKPVARTADFRKKTCGAQKAGITALRDRETGTGAGNVLCTE